MIKDMAGSPLIALYEMERALIQLDSADDKFQQAGLQTLQALADDKNNTHRDSAQYYLGNYYWAHNDVDKAHDIWQKLVDEQRDEKLAPSPWVQQVQQQLSLTMI
jgi:cytochrome c-type biogenesis protein CcmH/NrfG